ncbi:MAG TPA: ATP-binding protein [Flavisolibacter sp.]
MPPLTQEPHQTAVKPLFIGLQSYTEAQSDRFYGRDDEIDRLTNLVKANTLTIVFGKSGTGKTSLLNAGVFPRLRKDYCLPFRIRLEFQDDSPDLVTQIKNILKEEIDKYGFKVEAYPGTETLWEYFHREQLWKSVTPILIFDQFEEIFTLGKKSQRFGSEELEDFWNELADLIENSIPKKLKEQFLNEKENVGFNYKVQKIKTLFSFREEFLPEFESVTAKIPSIKYSRFRLLPMNGDQAYEVITKTWKKTIDATQAHKIVGFFANDADKDLSYNLMEIEPSLLSQVCSFIDKERVKQGKENISAEFLDKYPKEIILSSIYNEILAESNAAVNGGLHIDANGIQKTIRPVNEFIEDKLITDEGYRTKYVMTEQDERIRPGIEVLKSKYFVRDDGKSVELTHDVLTPLIKSDREERRKMFAMAAAKKKANRRALLIVAGALVAALFIWYLTANKAIQDKNEALKQKQELELQIQKDSASLAVLGKSIDSSQKKLDTIKKRTNLLISLNDSTLVDSVYAQMKQRFLADSTQLDSLQNQARMLAKEKGELEKMVTTKTKAIDDFTTYQKKSDSTTKEAKWYITNLQKRVATDSARLALMQKNYKELISQYDNYILQVSRPEVLEDDGPDAAYDTNSLHINLFYGAPQSNKTSTAKNMRLYLIPDTDANKRIIRNAKTYEMYCDELNLDKAKDKKIAKFKNGTYKFYDVPPGKYFVKICTYYGGFYTLTKSANGNMKVNWDASPPIR